MGRSGDTSGDITRGQRLLTRGRRGWWDVSAIPMAPCTLGRRREQPDDDLEAHRLHADVLVRGRPK